MRKIRRNQTTREIRAQVACLGTTFTTFGNTSIISYGPLPLTKLRADPIRAPSALHVYDYPPAAIVRENQNPL